MFYFFIFFASLLVTAILTWIIRKVAIHFNILDQPDKNSLGGGRKIHSIPMPLLGGVAIFVSYFFFLFIFSKYFFIGNLHWSQLWGFFIGGLIISLGGFLDDKYNLKPWQQIIFPILASVAVILGGVQIAKITNPWGGILNLQSLGLFSSLLIVLWLMGMMYTTKLLDGVDGLVSSISVVGGFIIFLFTLTTSYYQPDLAFAAILLAGTSCGFLIFNWHPAKIFLGEGGSLLLGYILGVLAIISGGKIAIALLIMGIPILDVLWTIIRRLWKHENPFEFSDKQHLHHRLLAAGLGQRTTVLIFCSLSLLFGLSGLFLQSRGKFLALLVLAGLMFLLLISLSLINKKKVNKS
jgi:UDP-GlcNAc:undecaprenyl-phosphate GlcNAc-1-phosphate transferase